MTGAVAVPHARAAKSMGIPIARNPDAPGYGAAQHAFLEQVG